jgi:hypothetical protein
MNMAYYVRDLLSVAESGMLPALMDATVVHWQGKGQKDEEVSETRCGIGGQ